MTHQFQVTEKARAKVSKEKIEEKIEEKDPPATRLITVVVRISPNVSV